MSDSRWYFTEEQLQNSPSRECGVSADRELAYRQQAANLIQEVGQRLQVSQLCINTAIVYMHRFYAFHSFTLFHRNGIAAAAFFLAAKVEEQPRKLEHVIKILNICLEKTDTRESYAEQAQDLVFNENVLLQTLGFDVAIDHPHTHVVRACQLFNIVTVSRELRQTCYFMASNSLHLTTMCLKYRPTVVAAFCIYIACKWSRWEIPDSSEGKVWYSYVDETVTPEILQKLTDEYLQILERSPSKFKSKMKAITSNGQAGNTNPSVNRDEGPSHKNPHDRHHHHHRSSSSSAGNANRKPEAVKQPSSQQAPPGYKPQIGQRPSSSSRPPYPPSEQKPNEDRTQHRQTIQEPSIYNSQPRPIDQHKQRSSSSQLPASSSSQPPMPHAKPPGQESQRHSMNPAKPPVDYHQKSVKQPPPPSQPHLSQQQMPHKKPSWPQQPPPQQNPSKPPSSSSQSHIQASHSQPNLGLSSGTMSNNRSSSSQSLPSYNESKQQQPQPAAQSSSQPMDFWFNDKLLEAPSKPISPLRQGKSMFSPSPEHEPAFDRTKMMMMGAGGNRDSPKNEKADRRSSTPSKRDKRSEMQSTPMSSQKSSSMQSKPNSVPPLIPDSQRKRPFSTVEDPSNDFNRETKARKIDVVKSEPNLTSNAPPMAKQPIETNPDIVKSLLQECYTTSKFDSFGMDSPLDVINPEPQTLVSVNEPLIVPKTENGFEDEHHKKRTKSKKKKDKHSKKKKSHKSDREDRKESSSSTSLKIILGKDKSDSKSSPESVHTGGLKIKIPIKDVNKTELPGGGQSTGSGVGSLKLKISKDKITKINDSSSSSSKKKDKDRSKSKHKHSSNSSGSSNINNNSEFKDDNHQQNKMNSFDPTQQQQPFGNMYSEGNMMQQQQQQQFYQNQFQHHQQPMMNSHNFPYNFNMNQTQSSYNANN